MNMHMRIGSWILVALALACAADLQGQVNRKGAVHLGLGLNMGAHATRYSSEFTIPVIGLVQKSTHRDGALTVATPFEVQYGFGERFSLGLYVEGGSYIDSAGTHPNKLFLIGLSPRYYAVNLDQWALYLHADLGFVNLQTKDVASGQERYTDHFDGRHFRLGVVGQYFFGPVFGIHAGLGLVSSDLKWMERNPNDPLIDALRFKASLKTAGGQFRLGVQVKL